MNSNYYSEDIKTINSIEFSIYTNKDIIKYSHITEREGLTLAESYENYEPKKNGLVDLRLGTCDIYLQCSTCGENTISCPGHFGHIDLSKPVFHYGFIKHLKDVLQCVCIKCSSLLLHKNSNLIKKMLCRNNKNRFKELKILSKKINQCPVCNTRVPKVKKDCKDDNGTINIILEYTNVTKDIIDEKTKKNKDLLMPQDCYDILSNVSDEDCLLLGFNPNIQRPEDLILKVFPVAPVIIRPSAKIDFITAVTMEDALTQKISDIIRLNNKVKKQHDKEIVSSSNLINRNQDLYYTLLQYHVATYFGNDSISLPKSEFKIGGKKLKSISERIKGKFGRVRNNLMGKRVEFSARTVITPDPYVDIDSIGVPRKIAMELTIPEEVTMKNINYMNTLVKNGKTTYPGANFIIKFTYVNGTVETQTIDLKYRKKDIVLKCGDIVERHIVNGDYILFNRQPTLHKISMMGHRIQVIDSNDLNSFRLNVSVCKPYNADFDGDEMNLHLGQSIQSRNEIELITNVKYQIISCKDSKPIIGCQQDTLSGGYMLSLHNKKIDGKIAANILSTTNSKKKYSFDIKKQYSGNEIFSYILPKELNAVIRNNTKQVCKIVNGELTTGTLDTALIGVAKNSIIHFMWSKYGANETKQFIDDTQKLVLNYLLLNGQTIGFKDVIIDDLIINNIKSIIKTELLKSKQELTQYENSNEFKLEYIESSLTSNLNSIQSNIGQILIDSVNDDNFFSIALKSGARGSLVQLAQVSGIIGQQIIGGSRLKVINDRTLFYFHRYDNTPEARGFIKSNYLEGLTGPEFFINATAGREGLIDTAIKTAQTGYIQCQLVKGLEDISVKYDNTTRNARNIIVQFVYGDNSTNQIMQIETIYNIVKMNNQTLKEFIVFTKEQMDLLSKSLKVDMEYLNNFCTNYLQIMKFHRDNLRDIQFKMTMNYKTHDNKFVLPININRIIFDNTKPKKNTIDLDPVYIYESINRLLESKDLKVIILSKLNDDFIKDDRAFKYLLEVALYEYLNPKKCIFEYNLSKNEFDSLIEEIKFNFIKSLVDPGEMVGVVAAQSIGEPTSQLNLNTKHFAGIASKGSANMGVERIQELLHYSKNIKTPKMDVYFKPEYNNSQMVSKIGSYFKYLTLKELLLDIEIYYQHGTIRNTEIDKLLENDNVSNPFFVDNIKSNYMNLPIVFRFKLDPLKTLLKDITLIEIKTKILSYWYKNYTNIIGLKKKDKTVINNITNCAILSNTEADSEYYIHIRFNMTNYNYSNILHFMQMITNDVILKGIKNINGISIEEERRVTFNQETGDEEILNEQVISTLGINFEKIKYIKGIDTYRTTCNDINTIYRMYGIEAARHVLLNEFELVYKSSNINKAHLSLLVDQMTHLGDIITIDRHGFNKLDNSTLSKVSFEQQMDHFVNAAIYNEKDNIKTISARVALGRTIPGGTCAFDILLDTDKIHNSEYTENEITKITFIPLQAENIFKDVLKNNCSKNYSCFIP